MGSKKQTTRKIVIEPVVITADEATSVRRSLENRDPNLIPNRFRLEGFDPFKFLFFRLLCLFEGAQLVVSDDSEDDSNKPAIRRGKNWISAQFNFSHNIKLSDPDILGLALSRCERKRPKDCAISYSEYEELLKGAWLALSGLTLADYEDMSPDYQAMVRSGELINRGSDDFEDDGFDFWEPVNDPNYGR